MSLAELILVALKLSIISTVFALGLRTRLEDLTFLLRHPGRLVRSILAMNFIMPLIAAAIVLTLDLQPPLSTLLIALSLAPVPPLLPKKVVKAGGDESYGASLLVIAALFTIVSIPISVEVIERAMGIPLSVDPLDVVKLLLMSLMAPLILGLVIHRLAPLLAVRLAKPVAAVAGVVLLLATLGLVVSSGRAMLDGLGHGTLIAITSFIVIGLAVGHLLGGPKPIDRTVLALATVSRHPGIALGITNIALPTIEGLLPYLLIYLLAGAVLDVPYMAWRKKQSAMPELAP